jgi:hypothetical protein
MVEGNALCKRPYSAAVTSGGETNPRLAILPLPANAYHGWDSAELAPIDHENS